MRWLPKRRPGFRFEFQPQRRSSAAAWLLLAVACAFAGDVGRNYLRIKGETRVLMHALSSRAADSRMPERPVKTTYQPSDLEREAAFARGVVTKIGLPWNDLFHALNATRVDEVQLVNVEPDTESRMVRITAEAPGIPGMLTYVARLESNAYFRNVSLLHHEMKRDAKAGPVTFVVAASWQAK